MNKSLRPMSFRPRIIALALGASLSILSLSACHQPDAPQYYGFQDVHVGSASAGVANLSATLKFFNPNSFNLKLKSAEVDVAINGRHAGHSALDSTILIPGRDTFYVPVSMQLELKSLLSNAFQLLMDKKVNVTLDGRVRLKRGLVPINRPFHYEGKEDISEWLPSGLQ